MFFRHKKTSNKPANERYQKEVDMQIKAFGRVSGPLYDNLKYAGLYLDKNNIVRKRKTYKHAKRLW